MPKYIATRWFTTRARYRAEFEADCDEAAKARLPAINWLEHTYLSSADLEDEDIDADPHIDLELETKDEREYIIDGATVRDCMPYSEDAQLFMKRVADLAKEGAYTDAVETLDELIREAAVMCGREI